MVEHVKVAAGDKRVGRTQAALFSAFFDLVTSVPYADIKVEDILARSGVGRSTFYEHFKSKDDILAVSLRHPFAALADAMRERENTADILMVLEHFRENRAIAPGMFRGEGRQVCVATLAAMLEERFKQDRVESPNRLLLPRRLAAIQLAEALLAPITAWLLDEVECSPQALAVALRQTAKAILTAQRQAALGSP